MEKLIKPCPYCGSNAELIGFNFEYGTVTVGCTNEDCDIAMWKGFFSEEDAIEHWNRRANKAEIRASAIDEFAEKLGRLCVNSAMALDRNNGRPLYNKDGKWHDLITDVAEQLKECE